MDNPNDYIWPELPYPIESVRLLPVDVVRARYPDIDKHVKLDYTAMSAIATCPRWGIGRYVHHRAVSHGGRAMPLEAGGAAHEFFAAVRMLQFLHDHQVATSADLDDRTNHDYHAHGIALFGRDRWDAMTSMLNASGERDRDWKNFALEALYTSGFTDDEYDKKRTMYNIEDMCLHYYDNWNFDKYPLFYDPNTGFLGAELEVNLVLLVNDQPICRFVGRVDGVHTNAKGDKIVIMENKTSSRLSEPWRLSFATTHQVTGYIIAVNTFLGRNDVEDCVVIGSQLPMPKDRFSGLIYEPVERPLQDGWGTEWFNWLLDAYDQGYKYHDDPMSAPMYTHSCNRFFRPCPYIYICSVPDYEERKELFDDNTVHDQWSPLDEVTSDE